MILTIDDDYLFLLAMERLFDGLTLPAATLAEGLRILRGPVIVDAVLLDRYLPGVASAQAAIGACRRASPNAAVLLVSAFPCGKALALRAIDAGAYGVVEKGDPEKLKRVAFNAISAARSEAHPSAATVREAIERIALASRERMAAAPPRRRRRGGH